MSDRDIKDDTELKMLLVPVYGFSDRTAAEDFMTEAYDTPALFKPQTVADFNRGLGYVMIPGWWSGLDTQMLVNRPDYRRARPPGPTQIWEKLRDASRARPNDCSRQAFTSVLLVGGRRKFYRHHDRDRAHDPGFWKRIDTGPRDCYAVFAHRDGTPLEPFRVFNRQENGSSQQTTKTISAARSGRVAIYAAVTVYNRDGSIAGNEMRLLLAEFVVLDRDARKDDMLRVTIVAQQYRSPDPNAHIPEIDLAYQTENGLDEAWVRLANEARNGFIRECAPAVTENEEYRRFHLRQRKGREDNERLPYGQRFEGRLEGLSWEEAVKLVKEPWQMAIVFQKYDGEPRFTEISDSHSTRWPKMETVLTPEERERIGPMMGYVAQQDNLWNYCGD